jgi:hypothetical protein
MHHCLVASAAEAGILARANMTASKSLQADKGKPSRHLRAHMARQLAFAAELSR